MAASFSAGFIGLGAPEHHVDSSNHENMLETVEANDYLWLQNPIWHCRIR